MEVSINGWYPSIIHFRKIFHHNQRAVGVAPWLWKPPKDGCHAIATKSQNAGSAGVISLGESMWKPKIHQNTKSGWWCNTHLEKWWSSSMGKMTSHMKWKKHLWNHQPECFILFHLGTAQEKVRSQSPHVIPCPNHLAGVCPKVAGLATSRPTPNICPTKQLRILCRINILRRSCKHFGYTQWFKF